MAALGVSADHALEPRPGDVLLFCKRSAAALLALVVTFWSFGPALLCSIASTVGLGVILWALLRDTGPSAPSAQQHQQQPPLQGALPGGSGPSAPPQQPQRTPQGAVQEDSGTQRHHMQRLANLQLNKDSSRRTVDRDHRTQLPCAAGEHAGQVSFDPQLRSYPSLESGDKSGDSFAGTPSLSSPSGATHSSSSVSPASLEASRTHSFDPRKMERAGTASTLSLGTSQADSMEHSRLERACTGSTLSPITHSIDQPPTSNASGHSGRSSSLEDVPPIVFPLGPAAGPADAFDDHAAGEAQQGTGIRDGVNMPLCSQGILRQTSGGSMPLTDWLIPEDELEMCKRPDGLPLLLGAGAFGKVYKAMKDGTQPVAVKIIIDQTHKQQMDFEREINMLSCLRDRNIVQFLGVCLDGDETMLVTEFMENGDLYRMISKDRERTLCWYTRKSTAGRPTFGMGRRIALDIARGLHFLHSRRIVHFDLKSPNVLLARNNTAKIADVGLAKILKDGFISTAQHEVGTFVWMAPECLMGKRCTEKVDIFSFAVILWEICTGLVPQRGQMRSVRVPEECPAAIADLIERGMDSDPDNRPTAKEIVKVLMMQDAVLREKLAKATPPKQSGEVQATRSPSQDLAESLSNAHVHFAAQVAHNCSNGAPGTQLFNQGVSSLMECGRWYSRMNHDLEQCLKQPDAQVEDSPAHHRMAELCEAAMAHRAEVNRLAPRWFRRFEMVRLEDSAAAKQDTQPPVHHWSNVASALQLTENQLSELLAKHRDVIFRLDQVKQQRQQLVTALQSGLTSDVSDSHYAAATAYMDGKDAGDALNQCLEQERTIQEQLWTLMVNSLSVVQMATARVVSHPWIPDILAIMNSLALDAASVR